MGVTLRPGIHYCFANGRTALLDIRRDRYLALPDALDQAFQALAQGRDPSTIEAAAIDDLIEDGILVRSRTDVAWSPAATIVRPTESLVDTPANAHADPGMFARAYVRQRITNRSSLRLPDIVEDIRSDLEAVGPNRSSSPAPHSLRALTSYLATRWLISTRDQCLTQSATLFHFLAHYGWRPQFVVAVRMAPFAAHAWLQAGESVLNDRLDHVMPYTPILVL